jgi:hypothetical protein
MAASYAIGAGEEPTSEGEPMTQRLSPDTVDHASPVAEPQDVRKMLDKAQATAGAGEDDPRLAEIVAIFAKMDDEWRDRLIRIAAVGVSPRAPSPAADPEDDQPLTIEDFVEPGTSELNRALLYARSPAEAQNLTPAIARLFGEDDGTQVLVRRALSVDPGSIGAAFELLYRQDFPRRSEIHAQFVQGESGCEVEAGEVMQGRPDDHMALAVLSCAIKIAERGAAKPTDPSAAESRPEAVRAIKNSSETVPEIARRIFDRAVALRALCSACELRDKDEGSLETPIGDFLDLIQWGAMDILELTDPDPMICVHEMRVEHQRDDRHSLTIRTDHGVMSWIVTSEVIKGFAHSVAASVALRGKDLLAALVSSASSASVPTGEIKASAPKAEDDPSADDEAAPSKLDGFSLEDVWAHLESYLLAAHRLHDGMMNGARDLGPAQRRMLDAIEMNVVRLGELIRGNGVSWANVMPEKKAVAAQRAH